MGPPMGKRPAVALQIAARIPRLSFDQGFWRRLRRLSGGPSWIRTRVRVSKNNPPNSRRYSGCENAQRRIADNCELDGIQGIPVRFGQTLSPVRIPFALSRKNRDNSTDCVAVHAVSRQRRSTKFLFCSKVQAPVQVASRLAGAAPTLSRCR